MRRNEALTVPLLPAIARAPAKAKEQAPVPLEIGRRIYLRGPREAVGNGELKRVKNLRRPMQASAWHMGYFRKPPHMGADYELPPLLAPVEAVVVSPPRLFKDSPDLLMNSPPSTVELPKLALPPPIQDAELSAQLSAEQELQLSRRKARERVLKYRGNVPKRKETAEASADQHVLREEDARIAIEEQFITAQRLRRRRKNIVREQEIGANNLIGLQPSSLQALNLAYMLSPTLATPRSVSDGDFGDGDRRSIWQAAKAGDMVRVQNLIKSGVLPNAADTEGATPLHWAARIGHLFVVQQLLQRYQVDPNVEDKFGSTALHGAVAGGHMDVVTQLLSSGARFKQDKPGSTPLHIAVANRDTDMISALLMRGGDECLTVKNAAGLTPYALASERLYYRIKDLLRAWENRRAARATGDTAAQAEEHVYG